MAFGLQIRDFLFVQEAALLSSFFSSFITCFHRRHRSAPSAGHGPPLPNPTPTPPTTTHTHAQPVGATLTPCAAA